MAPSQTEEDWKRQEKEDDALLNNVLNDSMENGGSGLFDWSRPLDSGDKADDAQDFEDISDDDLPDEDEPSGNTGGDAPGLTDDGGTSHDTDDLFGEDGRGSSPIPAHDDDIEIEATSGDPTTQEESGTLDDAPDWREINFDPEPKEANQDLSIPAPAESADDLVKQLWPTFERDKILDWNELLPPKKAHYNFKTPLKPPKPLQPTKISLDLAADQEKSFRTAGTATYTKAQRLQEAEARGLVPVLEESDGEDSGDDLDFETPPPDENLGGVSWADLEVICNDWEYSANAVVSDSDSESKKRVLTQEDEEWLREFEVAPAKKQKVKHSNDFLLAPRFPVPSFDNFETRITHVAKRPVLDLNDPHLLIDFLDRAPVAKRARVGGNFKRGGTGSLSKSLSQRFNISNDEAYDALKENHQSKVRAVVGEFTVEHSFPAIKLQWPYYRVKLYTKDARSYHRPALKFAKFVNQPLSFSKNGYRKKKHLKGQTTQEIFKESKDLSLADNSTAMLLEYSEEYPTVLSNFGMGSKIINYYRRNDAEDTSRPKLDVGETSVLLPEDRSPFARFGTVDPGEIVPTLHNAMYRAPVFKHEPKHTDFLVIRSSTGTNGTSWHLRNIDHLYTVGQQFPLVEIPKPSSRKVTTAAKNRMKMIAFRKIRHDKDNSVRIGEITEHIADSTDMQNRQKLKEFIHYSKEDKVWRMKPGEIVPEENVVRTMVKPEDVCVIDAMQVGAQHLEDAGYGKMEDDEDNEQDEEAEANDTQGLEQKLAPWKTSKNFIEASQGKAMLELHGDGDPSGAGMAFSFIKTSMKGGYLNAKQGPHATSADAIARERKANGGHLYNVDKQNAAYNSAIKEIWAKQKQSLSSTEEQPENDVEMEDIDEAYGTAPTPRSVAATPANFDDSVSQHSRISTSSRHEKAMRIVRQVRNKFGQVEEVVEVVRDHRVWREYQKRRALIDAENTNVYEIAPTGNADLDKKEQARIRKELLRLEKNKERRHAREKQKGLQRASADPDGGSVPEKVVGTTRKCANCGQTGHIKTNKKLCPLLNGTMKLEDNSLDHDFGAISAPVLN